MKKEMMYKIFMALLTDKQSTLDALDELIADPEKSKAIQDAMVELMKDKDIAAKVLKLLLGL